MPHRSRVSVADVPLDILCLIINDPDKYAPLIQGWRDAKGESVRAQQRADESGRIADRKEAAVAERLVAAEKRESELDERETALVELDQDLASRGSAVAAREQAAQEREQELAGRETTLDEKLTTVRSDLAALKGL